MKRPHLFFEIVFVLLTCIGGVSFINAQVMESTNYQIQSDSINVGGLRSTSSSYVLEDTTGEIATGISTSTNYTLHAGYQQMQEVYLALAGGNDVTLAPALGGLTGGTSNGSTTVTATTDSPSGYQLTIAAASDPAMQSGAATIADYAPAGAPPDFSFTTSAGESHFGFSPEGDDISGRFLDDGIDTCNTGSTDSSLSCWDGLATSTVTIAERTSPNHPSGTDTTINFRVGLNGPVAQAEGTYVATTTVTLLPL